MYPKKTFFDPPTSRTINFKSGAYLIQTVIPVPVILGYFFLLRKEKIRNFFGLKKLCGLWRSGFLYEKPDLPENSHRN